MVLIYKRDQAVYATSVFLVLKRSMQIYNCASKLQEVHNLLTLILRCFKGIGRSFISKKYAITLSLVFVYSEGFLASMLIIELEDVEPQRKPQHNCFAQ